MMNESPYCYGPRKDDHYRLHGHGPCFFQYEIQRSAKPVLCYIPSAQLLDCVHICFKCLIESDHNEDSRVREREKLALLNPNWIGRLVSNKNYWIRPFCVFRNKSLEMDI